MSTLVLAARDIFPHDRLADSYYMTAVASYDGADPKLRALMEAGIASLVQVIMSLQKEVIPPQHRFTAPPPEFAMETTNLRIPTAPVAWPRRPDRPRAASVSGFNRSGSGIWPRPDKSPSTRCK